MEFMKNRALVLTILALVIGSSAQAALKYWDINGTTPGSGQGTGAGTWDTTTSNWSTDSTGNSATTTFATSDTAVFSAGTDATGIWTLNVPSAVTAGGITVEEGTVQKATGSAAVTIGTGSITVNSGATFSIDGSTSISASSGATCNLNGSTMENRTTGAAGSFIPGSMTITISGAGGILSYPSAGVLNIIQTGTPGTIIQGSGGITKVGAGILAVATACTYSGPTIILNGTLRIRTSANRIPIGTDLTVTSPGVFDSALGQQVNTLNGNGGVTWTTAGALTIAGSGASTFSGVASDSTIHGSITKSGTGVLTLSGVNTYQGTFTLSAGTCTVNSGAALCGAICDVVVNGGTLNLNNTAQTIENLSSTVNAGTINLASGHTLTISPAGTSAYSGIIAGAGGIIKTASATETFSGANTYTGKTTVSGGTLNISSDGNLGTAAASFVADQLTLNGGTIGFTATAVDIPANRGITIGASGGTISTSSSQSPSIESVITGGALTKSSSGNINLNAANTFSGGLTITGGGVRFNNNSAAGSGTITVTPASIVTLRQLSPSGPTSVTLNNPITLNANNGNDIDLTAATGNTFTLGGPISGPGYLTVGRAGAPVGTVVLSGNNTYVGPTTINAGTMQLGSSTALGGGFPNPVAIATPAAVAGGFLYPVQVNASGILDLNAQTIGNSISLNGGQLVNNNASPAIVNGSPSGGVKVFFTSAGTGVSGGSTIAITGGGGSGATATASLGVTTASFTLNAGGSGYSGTLPTVAVSGGGGSGATATVSRGVTAASVTISSGTTTYSVAPTVAITGGGGSGATATANLVGGLVTSITIGSPGTGFTMAPTIAFSGGTVLVAGTNPTGTGNATGFTVVSVTVAAAGSGFSTVPTMTFTGANTTPATATGNANNFTVASINTTAAGSGYTSTPTVTISSGTGFVGQAIVVNDITLLANSTMGGTGDTTVSEPIIGAFGLTKSGIGKLSLNAVNSYSGATTVSAGTLLVNSPGSLAAGSAVTVASTATLGGTGTINGPTTVSLGGTLSTVDSAIGTLTLGSSLALSGTTSMEISKTAGTADKIVITRGTVTLGGNLTVVNLAGALALGDTFDLIDGTIVGTFASFNLPGLPAGLAWDHSQLAPGGDGTIKVICDGTLAAHAGANQSLCFSGSAVIGGSPTTTGGSGIGTYTYSWTPTTGLNDPTLANPTASPATTTAYTVTVTDANSCTAVSSSVTVTVGEVLAISTQPANKAVCDGSTATFSVTASGPGTLGYSWANNNNGGWGSSWATSGSGSTFRASSTDNDSGDPACTSFSSDFDINSPSGNALGMYGGSSGDQVATRTFTALAVGQVVSIDLDNGNVDTGSKVGFSLEASGGADVLQFYFLGGQSNYKYNDGTEQDTGIPFQRTGLRVEFSLTSASTYTLILTPCGGTPTKINGSYSGTIAQLKLFNGNTSGGNDHNVYFNNFLVGGYTDNADNYTGDYAGMDKGNQPILSGNGGSTYTTPALTVGNSGSQYQVTVYGCGGSVLSSAATVTVNPLPTVSVNSATICAGGSTTLTATTSASTPIYLWNPGGATTASITVSPLSTTTYTVTVTDGTTTCVNTGSGIVTVNPLPTVGVNSAAICPGGSTTLTATTSASTPSYLWSPGGETTVSITVSPSSTTIYTVTVTDGTTTCINSGSGTVTVNPLPTVSVNSATICAGGSATLTATTSATGPSYLWSPGGATTASIIVSPLSTTTYTVTVTDGTTTCVNSGSGTVTVNPLPAVSVNSAAICVGGSTTLTATTSASTPNYVWSPGGAITPSITVSPSSTTIYTVTVTDGATSCANSGGGTVTVNPLPTVSVNSATICAGSSTMLTATTGASTPSYMWSPGGETTASITVSPSSTTIYTVTVTDGTTTCINSGSGTVTVNPLPTVSVNSATICAGGSATLTATTSATGPSYLWSPGGATTVSITVSPASTTTYTVTVTDGTTSCANSGSGTVTVNPLPTVSVNSAAICPSGSATLTAITSASTPSYLWSPGGATTMSITVSPASTTTYTVTVTDGATSCANSGSGTVTVNPLPAVSVNSPTICAGGSATLTATTGAGSPSYLWSPGGATTASITVSPASTTTYTVTVTDGATSCANSGSGTVTVNSAPTADAGPTQTVCAGTPGGTAIGGSPTASGGTGPYTYSWTPTTGLSDATVANPTAEVGSTTTYMVTVTDHNGCTANASVVLTVPPLPNIESTTMSGTDVTLVWDSLAGQKYRVQYTTDLPDPPTAASWTDLTPDVTAAGVTATYTDHGVPATQRFYRIFIVCP
jgi:autotransporter-associated beta strand protein